MVPTFNNLIKDIEEAENRINFLTADRALFIEQLKEIIPEKAGIDIATHGCEPILLFLKKGKVVHTVKGANSGDVMRAAKEHVPPIATDEE